jgi:hypothetical protein
MLDRYGSCTAIARWQPRFRTASSLVADVERTHAPKRRVAAAAVWYVIVGERSVQ